MNELSDGNRRLDGGAMARPGQLWLLWLGFIMVSLNMRLIFATVGPLLSALHLSFTSTLLVTTLPLVLLSVFSVTGVKLRQRMGEERALFVALVLLCLGCAMRGGGEAMLLLGTAIGSVGIAVMNVIMPALARKRFLPQQMGSVMGIYALMLGVGAVIGAGGAFPLFLSLGADEMAAYQSLGLWALPALLALLIWLPQLRHSVAAGQVSGGRNGAGNDLYRQRVAWSVTLFFGLQVLNLYVFLAWMPTIFTSRGSSPESAALLFSASQFSLMIGGFLVPFLAARTRDQRGFMVLTILCCLVGTLGILYAPGNSAMVWVLLLGFGQGAGPGLGTYLFVVRSASGESAARLSAMAQSVGYLIAGLGPLLVGYLWKFVGSWDLPLLLVAGLLVLELLVCLPAGKNQRI
ncbi:MFS transporter [Erwinia sp. S38]|uniref:MFS transporter n=1 Tax=Erwinia sp. S38 TaxID=2769338 RepID=UPI00190E469C|nr:MFS transporter [Erwinia sp. S38]MBK0003598.1 MFS transporter [Erwinia sp. S38]